ncbi:MAG: 1-acyl-sn-glycerol-3-phosphate acyltransferase [Salinivirgaceae bacterium]|nr:1-acyl-sn-glycerol-3-phosphate acyltransferase [Salinivirgaceae bacterium]
MQKPIHAFSLGHKLLRSYSDFYMSIFYKTRTIVGLENIPQGVPIIFAPNHQNTLMDALSVLYTIKGQPVFMARSDIFRAKAVAKILRAFKILPIYRIRDGVKNLQNNDAVFEEAADVLENKKRLVVLPEGSHLGQRRLRLLKKGIARIAFMAEERNNFELGTVIIPVGLDYSNYTNFGSRLMVNIGHPIPVAKYKDLYKENDQRAMAKLMEDIREGLVPLMINIDNEQEYYVLEAFKDIYMQILHNGKLSKIDHRQILSEAQQFTSNALRLVKEDEQTYSKVKTAVESIKSIVSRHNLRMWAIAKRHYSWFGIIVSLIFQLFLLPVFVLGFALNIAPFGLPVHFARNIKDRQFLSSFHFVIGVVTFTVFYLLYLILLLCFAPKIWIALLAFLSIMPLGLAAFRIYVWYRKTIARARINQMSKKHKTDWATLTQNIDYLVDVAKTYIA